MIFIRNPKNLNSYEIETYMFSLRRKYYLILSLDVMVSVLLYSSPLLWFLLTSQPGIRKNARQVVLQTSGGNARVIIIVITIFGVSL